MKLNYHLSKGYHRNILIDILEEKIYYIPKELDNLDNLIKDYTPFFYHDAVFLNEKIETNSHVLFLEIEYNNNYINKTFDLASICLTDFLLFHVNNYDSLRELVTIINNAKKSGTLELKQIYICIDFELEENKALPFSSNQIISILSKKELLNSREVLLKNFLISKDSILISKQKNMFYYKRLYLNHRGFLKSDKVNNYHLHINKIKKSEDIMENPELLKKWETNKQNIFVCKDCEFKSICCDSANLIHIEGKHYKREYECEYNPYIAKWKGEINYYSLQECNIYSSDNNFSVNHKKIAEINTNIATKIN